MCKPLSPKTINTLKASFLVILMIAGLYLSLGAIFSLTYIKDSPDDKKAVIHRFDSTFRSQENFAFGDSVIFAETENSASAIQKHVSTLVSLKTSPEFNKLPSILKAKLGNAISQAADVLTIQANEFLLQQQLIKYQANDFRGKLDNIASLSTARFNEEKDHLSSALLEKFSEELTDYVSEYATSLKNTVYRNALRMQGNASTLLSVSNQVAENVKVLLSTNYAESDTSFQTTPTMILNSHFLPEGSAYAIITSDEATLSKLQFPKEGRLGADWGGVFSNLIGPIAGSKNSDVLLVIGMLGFGLFGAGIATFITGSNETGIQLLVVLVRGFSAAIVVYLASRGGVAVINKGNSDPDPLALFLFCFLGAVYSERIWAWAKTKISTSFSDSVDNSPDPNKNDPNTKTQQGQSAIR
jgi:hypothetical protein